MDKKSAYPYITKFKKEPFKSFTLIKRREIGNFFVNEYDKLIAFYRHFQKNLMKEPNLTLEHIFWFTLLRKYLKEEKRKGRNEIFEFIKKCEFRQFEQLGFRFSPVSHDHPDVYSTFLALVSLKNIGLLKEYFASEEQSLVKEEIKNYVLSLRKGNTFQHCHEKNCEICKRVSPARNLFYIMEIFTLLGVDIRNSRDQFSTLVGDSKRKSLAMIFRLLDLKYLDMDLETKDKEIQYFHQFQKETGGFSLNQKENINDTFWIVYTLKEYSWLLDYNPSGVYLFINFKLDEILKSEEEWNTEHLSNISKLIILLSLIWTKFIDEIERILFKELEKERFIDINQLKTTFGLSDDLEDIISYVNLNYNFNLRILDNNIEFKNFLRNLSKGKQEFIQKFYEQIKTKSIVSLTEIHKYYKTLNLEHLKLKEDIFPIIIDLISRNFIKGDIKTKKGFLVKAKYNFYLSYFLEKIIVSDTEINTERLVEEKEKLADIKNDIYNMTLKLNSIGYQIRDEINSYLLIDEIDYAKERLKFIMRNAVMEADFLNENIENSFNDILYYTNIKSALRTEISQWNKVYSGFQSKLIEVESYLKGQIQEKETLRDLNILLENLMEKLTLIEEDLEKKIDAFKRVFNETLEREYIENKFNLAIKQLNQINEDINKYDKVLYNISQQITTKEKVVVDKHREIINNWLRIKGTYEAEFTFYQEGFKFFRENLKEIMTINDKLNDEIKQISEVTKSKIGASQFKDAFSLIKEESDILLNDKLIKIKSLQALFKSEIKEKPRLYLLYKHLQSNLENLESTILASIRKQTQSLKDKVAEERNKTEIQDFDNFVSKESLKLKQSLTTVKTQFENSSDQRIGDVNKVFDDLRSEFEKANKIYQKNFNNCQKSIEDFEEKSKLTILQWKQFSNFYNSEISAVKEEFINNIISNKINVMTIEKKSNSIKLSDLKEDLNLSCKVLIGKLKDMIGISKINAELNENEKIILVFTNYYYLNKELRNFTENQLLKLNRERVGKILALYDSSIRNRTLNTNMLELQNRINDLRVFQDTIPGEFYAKAQELNINKEREEFLESKKYFESTIENDKSAISIITQNLDLFNSMQNYIEQQYTSPKVELKEYYNRFLRSSEDHDSFEENQLIFDRKKQEFRESSRQIQNDIENEIRKLSIKTIDSNKLIPEIREIFVRNKNNNLEDYNTKIEKIDDQIEIMKNESFRGNLIDFINSCKIKLSQLLGNLERKVEDNIEIKEFKRINIIIQKRAKSIEGEIKNIRKTANTMIREYSRQSRNFNQISKFVLDDFNKFIGEYKEILTEKVKSLERLILRSYIEMTIKAVANEYLTISFLNSELKIRKKNIQDHLLFLISSGELKGKFDPRFSIYFENPDILNEIDEAELEVIKNTNFKVNMALRHLKNFASQYGSIIAFFASILTISYYLFLFSGGNPAVIIFPLLVTVLIITYYFLRKGKDEKIN
ncbi:MAG: prenyltransferase/squalene oxidase repeat-containing protein [Promethearchaeota archaeon]